MNFAYSAKAQDYISRLQAFMEQEVYPAEKAYYAALAIALTIPNGNNLTSWNR
jgi:hypothetical protein